MQYKFCLHKFGTDSVCQTTCTQLLRNILWWCQNSLRTRRKYAPGFSVLFLPPGSVLNSISAASVSFELSWDVFLLLALTLTL